MLTLIHAPLSRSSRIIWLLEELGADYDIRYVDIRRWDGSGRPGRETIRIRTSRCRHSFTTGH